MKIEENLIQKANSREEIVSYLKQFKKKELEEFAHSIDLRTWGNKGNIIDTIVQFYNFDRLFKMMQNRKHG